MELSNITYHGPPIDDIAILDQLPPDYRGLLDQINGFIQFGGGLHIRGACREPDWHALATVWFGVHALYRHYPAVTTEDIPFGQDTVGDQFLLRNGIVFRLSSETGELESLHCSLFRFLEAAQADPIEYLSLQPLIEFYNTGGRLEPGQLISVYPPFCTKESAEGVALRAVPALERLAFLAHFAAQIAQAPTDQQIRLTISEQ
jgi:hypothetical protein